jgi:cytochrome c-type biogenesis protein
MTAPFVIAALFSGPFLRWTARNRSFLGYAEKVMGGMLIVFALLIATDSVNLIADAMLRWFPNWSSLG